MAISKELGVDCSFGYEALYSVRTDLNDLKRKLVDLGREAVACVISTTRLVM